MLTGWAMWEGQTPSQGQTGDGRVTAAEWRAALGGTQEGGSGVGGWARPHRALTFRRTFGFSLEPRNFLEGP